MRTSKVVSTDRIWDLLWDVSDLKQWLTKQGFSQQQFQQYDAGLLSLRQEIVAIDTIEKLKDLQNRLKQYRSQILID